MNEEITIEDLVYPAKSKYNLEKVAGRANYVRKVNKRVPIEYLVKSPEMLYGRVEDRKKMHEFFISQLSGLSFILGGTVLDLKAVSLFGLGVVTVGYTRFTINSFKNAEKRYELMQFPEFLRQNAYVWKTKD